MGLFRKQQRKEDRPGGTTSADPSPKPDSPTEQGPPAPDPVRELARLEGMRDRGELSPDEFITAKRDLLASQRYQRT